MEGSSRPAGPLGWNINVTCPVTALAYGADNVTSKPTAAAELAADGTPTIERDGVEDGAATTMVDCRSAVADALSESCTLKVNVPVAVGVPEITPLELFNVKPVGKAPVVIDQV